MTSIKIQYKWGQIRRMKWQLKNWTFLNKNVSICLFFSQDRNFNLERIESACQVQLDSKCCSFGQFLPQTSDLSLTILVNAAFLMIIFDDVAREKLQKYWLDLCQTRFSSKHRDKKWVENVWNYENPVEPTKNVVYVSWPFRWSYTTSEFVSWTIFSNSTWSLLSTGERQK